FLAQKWKGAQHYATANHAVEMIHRTLLIHSMSRSSLWPWGHIAIGGSVFLLIVSLIAASAKQTSPKTFLFGLFRLGRPAGILGHIGGRGGGRRNYLRIRYRRGWRGFGFHTKKLLED